MSHTKISSLCSNCIRDCKDVLITMNMTFFCTVYIYIFYFIFGHFIVLCIVINFFLLIIPVCILLTWFVTVFFPVFFVLPWIS